MQCDDTIATESQFQQTRRTHIEYWNSICKRFASLRFPSGNTEAHSTTQPHLDDTISVSVPTRSALPNSVEVLNYHYQQVTAFYRNSKWLNGVSPVLAKQCRQHRHVYSFPDVYLITTERFFTSSVRDECLKVKTPCKRAKVTIILSSETPPFYGDTDLPAADFIQ